MRSITKFMFAAIAFVVLAGTAANAQTFIGGKRPGSLRAMEDQIFHKILMLPNYGVFDHITYQVNGNTVVLGGSVVSLGTRKEAERVVKRVPGVERVENNIRDLPPSPSDDRIRRRLTTTLANTAGLSRYVAWTNPPVRLIVDHGRVSLEGYVDNRSDANTMNILANGVSGVFSVQNHLIVRKEMVR